MSEENYCPEIDNDSDFEVVSSDSDDSDSFDKELKLGDKINDMIKKEVADKFKVPNRMEMPAFIALKDVNFKSLTNEEKINKVAVAMWKTGGIDMENILELKMLMVLIGATEQMEGFKKFPREEVYKLLDMIIYHCNKHMKSLDI